MTLTKGDLDKIKQIVDDRLEDRLSVGFMNQKEEILSEIDDKLTQLKSDFYDKIDLWISEVKVASK